MVPFPMLPTESSAERRLYEGFLAQLSDEYVVYHSVDWVLGSRSQGGAPIQGDAAQRHQDQAGGACVAHRPKQCQALRGARLGAVEVAFITQLPNNVLKAVFGSDTRGTTVLPPAASFELYEMEPPWPPICSSL